MQYFCYLRRERMTLAFHFWLNKLNEFAGNFERAEMVKAFLVSANTATASVHSTQTASTVKACRELEKEHGSLTVLCFLSERRCLPVVVSEFLLLN